MIPLNIFANIKETENTILNNIRKYLTTSGYISLCVNKYCIISSNITSQSSGTKGTNVCYSSIFLIAFVFFTWISSRGAFAPKNEIVILKEILSYKCLVPIYPLYVVTNICFLRRGISTMCAECNKLLTKVNMARNNLYKILEFQGRACSLRSQKMFASLTRKLASLTSKSSSS